MTFSEWHSQLPPQMKKGDQLRAKQRFERIVKAGEFDDLQRALQAYYEDQRKNAWRQWEYSSTFLGSAKHPRWREWLVEADLEILATSIPAQFKDRAEYDLERAQCIQRIMQQAFKRGERKDVPEIAVIIQRLKA